MTFHAEQSLPQRWPATLPPGPAPAAERAWEIYFSRHPVMARINRVAGYCAEMLGPMCWAALVVMFFWVMTLGNT
jgi:hypothetical protein